MTKQLTYDEFEELLVSLDADNIEEVRQSLQRWFAEGKGVAVYENHDLGHWNLGHKRFFSYGTPTATFPDDPPERLPDFPTEINWRYMLAYMYSPASENYLNENLATGASE